MIPLVPLKGVIPFSSTMRYGKRFACGSVTAVITFRTPSKDFSVKNVAVGVSIRKKTAKKATVRNRAKRLLRVSIRQVLDEFDNLGWFSQGCAFERMVLFCNTAPKMPSLLGLKDILPDVRCVMTAALEYYQQRMNRYENNTHPSHSGI